MKRDGGAAKRSTSFVDVVHVDLSKHSEDRIPTMRGNLQNWLNVASWHRPSVIVLDNLDRVVGPEVEVGGVTAQHLPDTDFAEARRFY